MILQIMSLIKIWVLGFRQKGSICFGDKGQIVIPAKARKLFDISPGDQMVILGDETQGLALIKSENFLALADLIRKGIKE